MAEVRVNWFPRWQGSGTDEHVSVGRASDGSLALSAPSPTPAVRLTYAVQPLDWLVRALALGGMLLVMFYPLAVPLRARGRYHVASRERSAANS